MEEEEVEEARRSSSGATGGDIRQSLESVDYSSLDNIAEDYHNDAPSIQVNETMNLCLTSPHLTSLQFTSLHFSSLHFTPHLTSSHCISCTTDAGA